MELDFYLYNFKIILLKTKPHCKSTAMGLYNFAEKINTMESKEITNEEILQIPIINLIFSREEFKEYLDTFVKDVNKGKDMGVKKLLALLIEEYCKYCGISLGYRTIVFDFAYAILNQHHELWSEEDKEEGYILGFDFKKFYPEYDTVLDEYDITRLECWQYIVYSLNLLIDNELGDESKLAFSYAFYNFVKDFFKRTLLNNTEERIAEELKVISKELDRSKREKSMGKLDEIEIALKKFKE